MLNLKMISFQMLSIVWGWKFRKDEVRDDFQFKRHRKDNNGFMGSLVLFSWMGTSIDRPCDRKRCASLKDESCSQVSGNYVFLGDDSIVFLISDAVWFVCVFVATLALKGIWGSLRTRQGIRDKFLSHGRRKTGFECLPYGKCVLG